MQPLTPEKGLGAIFLDRDGTLNREVHYLARVEQLELLPGVPSALRTLQAAGWPLVVVTNQSGIAQGLLDEQELGRIHVRLAELLAAEGVQLLDILHCPHHPILGELPWRRECDCRKPGPGLLLEAARRHAIDLTRSWMLGDSTRDVRAGHAAGCRAILLRTGQGAKQEKKLEPGEAKVCDDLEQAADFVLAQGR